ncbi:hypothetical protein [Paraburkholderia phenoliruptrix]|uniref:hypothetical protein n=1 Tax=Paraburkholderia phenoliruptrix TaxID=252970 RepID=UPI00285938EB|nr:hypothetical protein [Paraburkholderia phenoliruptrix]MDR6393131.1 hypothetical protein [Paraburkholderia phenoliruptrix]
MIIRPIRFFAVALASIACGPVFSQVATLCNAHEEIYFSCHVGEKIVSVCASGNISPKNGYVQYRFGKLGRIELEYPKLPYPPMGFFSISDIDQGNVQTTHLKFKSGRYNYVVYSGFPSGLYVKKDGRIISNLICDSGGYESISPRAFRGIPVKPPQGNIDN